MHEGSAAGVTKRILCLLMICLLILPAAAEAPARQDAAWFYPMLYAEGSRMHLLTDVQLTMIAGMPSEEVHAVVEAMFLAAAGVEEGEEIQLWKTLRSGEERTARSAANADYRARTLPWLLEAFAPGNRPETEMHTARPTPSPAPVPTATPVPLCTQTPPPAQPEPGFTVEDSWEAFAGNPYGAAFLVLLTPYGAEDAVTAMAVTQAVVQRWLAEIDHAGLAEINGHYQLWLYAPDTPIDYPVVQCGNNSYYLDRMFNRKSNPAGTLFIDYRNLPDFDDPNTLIYGHHMRDSSMFHSLTDYDTPGYFDAHPFMLAVSGKEIYVIEVFAGYVTTSRDHCYDIAISDAEDMRQFVDTALRKSDFTSHVEIDCHADRLVTLSTCAYNFENARCIIIGRLNRVWKVAYTAPAR